MKTLLNNLWTHIGYEDDGRLVHTDKRTGARKISLKAWFDVASARRALDAGLVQQNRVAGIEGAAASRLIPIAAFLNALDRIFLAQLPSGAALSIRGHRNHKQTNKQQN